MKTDNDSWIGLFTRQSVIDQLVHTASLEGLSADDLADVVYPTKAWRNLVEQSFIDPDIRKAVRDQLRGSS